MKYTHLLFDIDGTVLDFKAAERGALKKIFREFGLGEISDEQIERYSKINWKYWEYLERNEMTKAEILVGRFTEFFRSEGIDVSIAPAFNDIYQLALGDTIVFHDNAFELLNKLKKDCTICAVTNGTKEAQKKKLGNSGLDKLFDYIFISEDIGIEKPNTGFFDAVFRDAGIKDRKDTIIIGDSLTGDIRGGLNYDIDTVWYNPEHKENSTGIEPKYEISDLWEIEKILY
ncbi:MAG: YjjG family noncanonical pyrimidine nucleotidase [Clostridia bacterium]|nr:YjjG family noncanonical pyrimidine nucleotidase [Clostridia bacterium]